MKKSWKLSLIGLGLASILLGGVVSAQEETDTGSLTGDIRDLIENATGLIGRDLHRGLRGDATLETLIIENGGDADAVWAEIEAILTTRVEQALTNEQITPEQADAIRENLTTWLENGFSEGFPLQGLRERWGRGGQRGGGGFGGRQRGNVRLGLTQLVLDETGLTREALLSSLRNGSTLAEILTEYEIDLDAFIAEASANYQSRLDEAVERGSLTNEQAIRRLEIFQEALTERLNSSVSVSL